MYWIFSLPVAVLVVAFAFQNPQMVSLTFWPFPSILEISLPLVLLGVFVVGFFTGSLTTWIKGFNKRRLAREGSSQIKHLQTEIAVLKEKLAASRAQVQETPEVSMLQGL